MLLCGCVLLPFCFYFNAGNNDSPASKPELTADHLLDIQGFSYTFNRIDHGPLIIKADRLTIAKKKIGHVSVGGFAAARLKNVTVQLDYTPPEAANHERGYSNAMFDDSVLRGIDIPFSSMHRIVSVTMAPIRVELVHRGQAAVHISAESAAIRTRTGDMVFKHGVMVSGPRRLKAARLSVSPDFKMIKARGSYVLTIPAGEYRGNRLNTDIHLTFFKDSESSTYMKLAAN